MGEKTAGVGHFAIPTAPAAGTSITSGAANTFTTTPVVLSASAPSALFITGVHLESAAALAATYIYVQLMVGGSGSETIIGQYLVPLSTASTVALGYRAIYPPIPVASGARLTAKTADSVGAKATLVTLECIAQSNVVDDGVAVGTVTNVTNQLTAAQIATGVWQDTTAGDFTVALSIGKSVMNGVALGTGLTINAYTGNTAQTGDSFARLGAPVGASHSADVAAVKTDTAAIKLKTDNLPASPASTTNITAAAGCSLAASQHVIVDSGTVTTLTNLPAITAGWLTATGIAASALNGKGDWNIGKTGYSLTQAFPTNFSSFSLTAAGLVTLAGVTHTGAVIPTVSTVSAVTGLTASNLDVAVSTRLASGSYTAPPSAATNASAVRTELATELGRIDAAVSTRLPTTSYTAPDNASITSIKASTDNLPSDPADESLIIAATDAIMSRIGVAGAGLTAIGDARLANLDAAVSTRSTYAGGDTSGTTTLLTRLSAARALALDYLDAAITSRLASGSYTAPPSAADNAAAVRTELSTELGRIDAATSSRLAATSYTEPDNTSVAAIKVKTDQFAFTAAGKVDANITAINGVPLTGTGAPGDEFGV